MTSSQRGRAMNWLSICRAVLMAWAMLVLSARAAAAQPGARAHFIGLGDLPGGEWLSIAHGISADGSVVVGQSRGDRGPQAFCWKDGVMMPLAGFPEQVTVSMAHAVSADGTVIVGSATASHRTQAFRYQIGADQPFSMLSRGTTFSEAWGVNADGSVIVGHASLGTQREAFIWRGGIMRFVAPMPQGWPAISARGISADGSVVAGNADAGPGSRGFRLQDGRAIALASLSAGVGTSEARAISAGGRFIAGAAQSRWGHEACVWSGDETAPRALGALSDHHELYSYAMGVSADGSVIVGSSENELGRHEAFVWTAIDGMRPLAELLVHDFDVDLAGWSLSEATAVSDDGRTIVGFGRNPDGKFEAWLVRFDGAHWPNAEADSQSTKQARFGGFRGEVTGLAEPSAVAIDADGIIHVAETAAGRISLRRGDGTEIASHELADGMRPRDLALTADGLYALDAVERSVAALDRDGTVIRRIELPRTGEFAITDAAGIAMHEGRMFIVDRAADRVVEFDASGVPRRAIGRTGNGPGELRLPCDIAVADDGSIFVADAGNHRVQKFDDDGGHQLSFGQRGNVLGFLMSPAAVAVHGEFVLVVDSANHRVQAFDRTTGRFDHAFGRRAMRPHVGEGSLHHPDAIAVAPSGEFVVVAESLENRYQVFDRLDAARSRLAYTAAAPVPARANFGPHIDVDGDIVAVTQTDADTVELISLSSIPAQPAAIIGGHGDRPGLFIRPAGVKLDRAKRRLLVTDHGTRRLQAFQLPERLVVTTPLDPTVVRFVRSVECRAWSSVLGADALEIIPDDIELDAAGNLYVLDRGNRVVFVLDDRWQVLRVLGSSGDLREPTDIALHPASRLVLVCDRGANRVLALDAETGEPRLTIPASGTLDRPWGVYCDDDGFVYATDDRHRVQKFDHEGNRVLEWGEPGLKIGQMYKARGIAARSPDRLIVTDWGNHRLLTFSPGGEFFDAVGSPLYVRPAKLELD